MNNSAQNSSTSDRSTRIAGPIHTALVLSFLCACAFWRKIAIDHLSIAANPSRVRYYWSGILFEWLLFFFILTGVRRTGASIDKIVGDRWHSVGEVLRDIGIAAGFWAVTLGLIAWRCSNDRKLS